MEVRNGKSGLPPSRVGRVRSPKERKSSKARMRRLREDPNFREREHRRSRALTELGRRHASELERIIAKMDRGSQKASTSSGRD